MTPRLLVREARVQWGAPAGEGPIALTREQTHYLTRVLRLGEGASIEVFDGTGGRYQARLGQAGSAVYQLHIETELPASPPPQLSVTLAQCLSSADKMDWTVEKAVELGVTGIVPLFSDRSLIRLDPRRSARKHEHWQAIIEAACRQCGQDRLPELHKPQDLEAWLRGPSPCAALRLILTPTGSVSLVETVKATLENDPGANLGAAGRSTATIALLVGPESGFSDIEIQQAIRTGWQPVRLGPRVLRTETAGLAAIAALAAVAGDFR